MSTQKLFENLRSFATALVIALLLRTFVVQSFHIPTGSMVPTLLIGDFILVDKVTYHLRKPKRVEIVVFRFPLNKSVYYIKRIVGVPGDTVQMVGGKLLINGKVCNYTPAGSYTYTEKGTTYTGKLLTEFLPSQAGVVRHPVLLTGNAGSDTELFTVPQNKYFMMGDNRNNSYDSRFWGFVDKGEIVGIARVVLFSWDSNKHFLRLSRFFHPIK
jgi:signal peptidase I